MMLVHAFYHADGNAHGLSLTLEQCLGRAEDQYTRFVVKQPADCLRGDIPYLSHLKN